MEAIHRNRIESGNALVQNAHAIGLFLSMGGTILLLIITLYIKRIRKLAMMKGAKPVLIQTRTISSILIILLGVIISFLLLVS